MIELKFPCPENAGAMPSVTNGKYCATCSRSIVDYSGKSNDEIRAVLESSGSHCGIFSGNQLSNISRNEVSTLFRFAFALVFFLGMNFATVHSQVCENNPAVTIERIDPGPVQLSGRIVDEYGNGIKKATILVDGDKNDFILRSDENGNIVLDPRFCISENEIIVTVSAKDMVEEQFILTDFKNGSYQITVVLSSEQKKYKKQEIYLGFMGRSVVGSEM